MPSTACPVCSEPRKHRASKRRWNDKAWAAFGSDTYMQSCGCVGGTTKSPAVCGDSVISLIKNQKADVADYGFVAGVAVLPS